MTEILWTLAAAVLFRLAECIVKVKKAGKITISAVIKEFFRLG